VTQFSISYFNFTIVKSSKYILQKQIKVLADFEFGDDIEESEPIVVKKSTSTGMIVALIAAVAVAAFFAGTYFSNIDSDVITKSDLEDALSKVESKLGNNPQTSPQQASPQPSQPLKVSLDDDPIRGNPDAEITIVEFSDFQCPFCARFHSTTLPQIEQNYLSTGKVNFVYRDFPIQSIHPNALPAALASECADDQGKFWEYHDKLFENQRGWQDLDSQTGIDTFKGYAQELGMNMEEFDSCLDSGKYSQEVNNDLQDGRNYGVTGTPGFFVGNEKIGFTKITGAQPYSVFQRVLDGQLDS
jgi:protein-disulfide isomerase